MWDVPFRLKHRKKVTDANANPSQRVKGQHDRFTRLRVGLVSRGSWLLVANGDLG